MDLSFYKGKKVLVTGHTGFKGSWLCRILVKAGAEVTGYSLEAPTDPNLFSMADVENNINSVIGDIRDLAHLKEVFKEVQPEIVLHLAANGHPAGGSIRSGGVPSIATNVCLFSSSRFGAAFKSAQVYGCF